MYLNCYRVFGKNLFSSIFNSFFTFLYTKRKKEQVNISSAYTEKFHKSVSSFYIQNIAAL